MNQEGVAVRFVKVDEVQFLTSVKREVWGSNNAVRFKRWRVGEYQVFVVGGRVAGLARVVGEAFVSRVRVWDNGLFPHRIPIQFQHLAAREDRLAVVPSIQEQLWSANTSLNWAAFTQHAVSGEAARKIVEMILAVTNSLDAIRRDIDLHLEEARRERAARA